VGTAKSTSSAFSRPAFFIANSNLRTGNRKLVLTILPGTESSGGELTTNGLLRSAGRTTATGREVAVLASGRHEPGRYAVPLRPCMLSSGVYFLRLEAGAEQRVVKVVLQ
jgi:hypothetical protein